MADNDVDDILQKFFVTIAEKDSDALKLYEDNKRMRALVEQTLHAREELESRHRATVLLVDSLQAALQEKERLNATQDAERAEWRERIAELRVLLDRPSELDHGLEDLVEDVRNMSAELRSLRHAFQYAQWCCNGWGEYAAAGVIQAESREREVAEETACTLLHTVHVCACEMQRVQHDTEMRSTRFKKTIAEWEAWHDQMEENRQKLVAEHSEALQQAEKESQQQQARADALKRELDAARADADAQARNQQRQHLFTLAEQENAEYLTQILEERCRAAERHWASTVQELRRVVQLLANAQKERDEVTAKHELILLTHDHNRQRLLKLTKQVDQLKHQRSEFDDLQQRYSEQKEELRILREKYSAIADKERNLRQQLHSTNEAAAVKLQAAEDAASTNQRNCFSLEERLRATQEDLMTLQNEMARLRRQCEEHRATQAVLQETQEQLRETERHAFSFQVALDHLKEEQQAELRVMEARHAEAVAEMRRAHGEELAEAAQKAQAKTEDLETSLRHAQEAHAREKTQLQRELQEWITEVETQKKEKAAQHDRLEAERSARQLLERQYREETSVMHSIMLEHSRGEAERGPHLAELEAQVSATTQRNNMLEDACRRSASVIAQMREALHREQMTTRTLRQREASRSP